MNIGLVLAGGVGTRMGALRPKQYLEVNNKPIIAYTLELFEKHKMIDKIVIVADPAWRDYVNKWLEKEKITKFICYGTPGSNRQHSIYNALKVMESFAESDDVVIVHDAVRPLVSNQLIAECITATIEKEAAMPVLPVKDTLYQSCDGIKIDNLLNRSEIFAGQAPEGFKFGPYYAIHNKISYDEINAINGSTELPFRYGMDIKLIPGDERNFKITCKEDLERFKLIMGMADEV